MANTDCLFLYKKLLCLLVSSANACHLKQLWVLIANKVFNESLSIKDVERKGITQITFDDIAKAKKDNKVIKLVGSGKMESGTCALRVAPEALEMDHPLSAINYAEKAISFVADTMGRITVSGGKSSPMGAAAALLKDVIHSYQSANKYQPPGFLPPLPLYSP